MESLGRIDEFICDSESFSSYSERVTQYFIANYVTDVVKKGAKFLNFLKVEQDLCD